MSPTVPQLIIHRGEPAFIDRFISGSYPGLLTEPRSPTIRNAPRRFLINIEMAEAGLSRKRRHASHQGRIILGDDSLLRWDVDHAVVTGDDHCHLRGQSSTQPFAHGIDSRELLQPISRVTAVYVPIMIKLALVRVDHGAITAQ